ncbi:MAG: hypothetical protein AB7T06_42205 [Kofleriaceae bacterium]
MRGGQTRVKLVRSLCGHPAKSYATITSGFGPRMDDVFSRGAYEIDHDLVR